MSLKIPGGIAPVLVVFALFWLAVGAVGVAWVGV